MNSRGSERVVAIIGLVPLLLILGTRPALAYLGPGSGLMAVGMFLAVVAAIGVAIAGFLWYPLKRLVRRLKGRTNEGTGASDR